LAMEESVSAADNVRSVRLTTDFANNLMLGLSDLENSAASKPIFIEDSVILLSVRPAARAIVVH
jgi:hypothetical protein